jgi:hypothetical protein
MLIDSANSPELSGKYLGTITEDFVAVSEVLKEASYALRQRGISDHPIFPICKTEQPVGALLIDKNERRDDIVEGHRQWSFYISYLDEFIQRELIEEEGLPMFMDAYRDPDEYCCLMVLDPEFTNFVFIPYPED